MQINASQSNSYTNYFTIQDVKWSLDNTKLFLSGCINANFISSSNVDSDTSVVCVESSTGEIIYNKCIRDSYSTTLWSTTRGSNVIRSDGIEYLLLGTSQYNPKISTSNKIGLGFKTINTSTGSVYNEANLDTFGGNGFFTCQCSNNSSDCWICSENGRLVKFTTGENNFIKGIVLPNFTKGPVYRQACQDEKYNFYILNSVTHILYKFDSINGNVSWAKYVPNIYTIDCYKDSIYGIGNGTLFVMDLEGNVRFVLKFSFISGQMCAENERLIVISNSNTLKIYNFDIETLHKVVDLKINDARIIRRNSSMYNTYYVEDDTTLFTDSFSKLSTVSGTPYTISDVNNKITVTSIDF